ncbi:xylulokinase [Desemzia sp. RIT804]|uniref:xylulokinase n=1 Tax=Desemzia sp. RIT 804 TaxID=2810209 RepID=UPI00194F61CA|nr:xylulokinase [Desemzia sp. RIT 804]MBM6614491.1 xylulokinase [Desemzia sp. RIT 804]
MSYVLGLDLGTGSLKGLLMDQKGSIVTTKSSEYDLISTQPGYSEQQPADWVEAAKRVIQEIVAEIPEASEKIEAISFSGQMHSLVLLDQEGSVLRNAILWNDVRTTLQCEVIMDQMGDRLIEITKNKALEGFTLPKLLWVKEHEPEIWNKVARFLLPKDYLGFWLTGHQQMEYSDAAGTLLLDVTNKLWSQEILETFDIPAGSCPPLVNSIDCIGTVKKEIAEELGLKNEVRVIAGGADNACAAIGAGIVHENTAMCSIGTSGVFLAYEPVGTKNYDGHLHYFNHAEPEKYYSMGVTLAAGHSLNWFKKTFAKDLSYEELLSGIEKIAAGSDGLFFTPYIVGERTPYTDSQVRGSFIGMDVHHTLKHFAKAVLEGITFSLKDSQLLMEQYTGKQFNQIVSVGGGAKNKDWLQMQADIFDAKVVTLETEQGPAKGATMLAAVGAGWYETVTDCANEWVDFKEEYSPNVETAEHYGLLHKKYQEIYPATKALFVPISE